MLRPLLWAALVAGVLAGPARAEAPVGVVFAVGDLFDCDGASRDRAVANVERMTREIAAARADGVPVAVMLLGDLAYVSGTKAEFACFDSVILSRLRAALAAPDGDILPVIGNHDARTADGRHFYRTFAGNAYIGTAAPGAGKGYYTLRFPPGAAAAWQFYGLNSEIAAGPASAQGKWLAGELAKPQPRCILGFWHRPVASSGEHGHGGSNDLTHAEPAILDAMVPSFEALMAAHGTLVLTGHDHDYEELRPHDATGAERPDGGLRSFVVGTGGRALYARYAKRWKASALFDNTHYGFLRLRLYADRYAWTFLPGGASNEELYAGEAACTAKPG